MFFHYSAKCAMTMVVKLYAVVKLYYNYAVVKLYYNSVYNNNKIRAS